jgi:hypothetical protein
VLCSEHTGEELHGEGYGAGGLTFKQLADKFVVFASDGTNVMFGKDDGALVRLQRYAPHAVLMWDPAHRTGLAGRDLEVIPRVKEIKDLVKIITSDTHHSTQRTQLRLSALAEHLGSQITINSHKDIRWLSLHTAVLSICKQFGVLAHYYMQRGCSDNDAQSEGIHRQLADVRLMAAMHGLLDVLNPINIMCKRLQSARSGVCDVKVESEKAIRTLQHECIQNADSASVAAPGCSGGKHFAALVSNSYAGVDKRFSVQLLRQEDARVAGQMLGQQIAPGSKVLAMVFGELSQAVVLWHKAIAPVGRSTGSQPQMCWGQRLWRMRAQRSGTWLSWRFNVCKIASLITHSASSGSQHSCILCTGA